MTLHVMTWYHSLTPSSEYMILSEHCQARAALEMLSSESAGAEKKRHDYYSYQEVFLLSLVSVR